VKSPCSPQMLGFADAVDETYVELWLDVVEDGAVDNGTLWEYDDLIVVELPTCDEVDGTDVEVWFEIAEDGGAGNGTPVLYPELAVVELAT
jgi:hypothetical protein